MVCSTTVQGTTIPTEARTIRSTRSTRSATPTGGIIDNLSGQNLFDWSLQLNAKPAKKVSLVSAFHWFEKATSNDYLYNVAGAPVGTLGGSRDIGQELDLIAIYKFNPNFNIQAGYSWFWYGDFVGTNIPPRNTATQFYVQTTLRF
ncbi:hypothetical protein F1728_13855 [Gimesia benthica]|uniref:Alginate export domain-containing protein n=1 Tax=Gimesia benthica TaxID=2608982 RepID=A0A6I6AC57_9PLAN|nr:hypothetical protein F1728_13855 [Gimesia benthica]